MTTYAFRIRFELPDSVIDEEAKSLEIPIADPKVVLFLCPAGKGLIRDAHSLTIVGRGFGSFEDAKVCGIRAKRALIQAALSRQIGLDAGKNIATGRWGEIPKKMALEKGYQILDDVHGLSVYAEQPQAVVCSLSASAIVCHNAEMFVKGFLKAYSHSREPTEREALALELCNASYFERQRASFLTLVTAVEVLASQEQLPPNVISHLDHLIRQTRASLKGPEGSSLAQRLELLKRESVSAGCEKLVRQHLDAESARQFKKLYGIRSTLVHEGKVASGVDIGSCKQKMKVFVSRLLQAILGT